MKTFKKILLVLIILIIVVIALAFLANYAFVNNKSIG